MSKTNSGLFIGTTGSKSSAQSSDNQSHREVESTLHGQIKQWAENKISELTGKSKKNFNTACVAYDEQTGNYYYGRNGGYREEGYVRNPELFGDSSHTGLLPQNSLNKYPVGNCAEVDAINQALNAGANLSHLHITTIHTTKNQFGQYKKSCENCTFAFKGRIKVNYSGWKEEVSL